MNQRGRRVSESILREIGMIIQFEMRDPRLKAITITGVKVSDDLSYAKVYYTTTATPAEIKEITHTLNHAQGFLRTKIGERIEMKYVPQLKFFYDESIDYADKMEKLFKEIRRE